MEGVVSLPSKKAWQAVSPASWPESNRARRVMDCRGCPLVDVLPLRSAFGNPDRCVDRHPPEALLQAAWPADLQRVYRLDTGESKLLLARQAAEVGAPSDSAIRLAPP